MKSLKILTIDDDNDFLETVCMSLRQWGHDVTTTQNWLTFMRTLKEGDFDLIVADVMTPTGNGLTALSFLSEDAEVAEIPKAFVTGCSDAETVRGCYELGAMYIFKSPVAIRELKSFVSDVATGKANSQLLASYC